MDSLCASNDSRFAREATINRPPLARRAPCRATHAQQQPTTQLFREADHGFRFTLNWAF